MGGIKRTFQIMIAEKVAEHIEVPANNPRVKSASFLAAVEIRNKMRDIIGPDDMSPAAQKLRAELRKM
jgi:hypothetical protein